jgi:hypothetical protein
MVDNLKTQSPAFTRAVLLKPLALSRCSYLYRNIQQLRELFNQTLCPTLT